MQVPHPLVYPAGHPVRRQPSASVALPRSTDEQAESQETGFQWDAEGLPLTDVMSLTLTPLSPPPHHLRSRSLGPGA
ncbi:hypothetical protein BV25DRAFT_821058 [Artomyces pyxidatus]|uniref:Uncharacterized protein n=1 Tax=Artomyces pyxidatus TaxID=48021 RepID=A0ACB8SX80_9AGAM|nr:hypothetical protein BV25DRAFT_821058 [Artomyces pyxidatus]